jgi:single stranded DNA-binding protein
MINQVTLEGRLGRNPDVFMAQNGRQVAKFSLATSSTWKDEAGEWQTKTYWHSVVVHRESTICWINVLKQGDLVRVEGKLTYHYWTDRHDQQRRKAQISITENFGKVEYADDPKKPKALSGKLKDIPAAPEAPKHSESTDLAHQSLRNMPFLSPQPNSHTQPHQHTGETL